ncbi:MAG: hypothetical protein LUH22_07180 [Bacteroides sp.]|nr:hypothetical protein [Bacteroides sp.]
MAKRKEKKKRVPRKRETMGIYRNQIRQNKAAEIQTNTFISLLLDLIDLIFYLFLTYQYLRLWISPGPTDGPLIYYFCILMGFEFIMIHSGVFMAVLKPVISILIFFPVYGLFAWAFTSMIGDLSIVWLYLMVVFNRMRYAFFNVNQIEKTRVIITAAGTAIIYFVLLFVVLIFSGFIPPVGLTPDFLESSGYYEVKRVGGILTDYPETSMCFGALYYILIAMMAFKMKRVKGLSPWD